MSAENLDDSQKEFAKFLERDFKECFAQMRHYDGQIVDVCKFAFGAYTTATGGALALYKYGLDKGVDYSPAARAVLGIAFLLGVVMVSLVVRNRVYFVFVTRYVNEHRGFFLKAKPLGFENNTKMYTNNHQPPFFDWCSSQSLLLYVLIVLNTGVFVAFMYLASPSFQNLVGIYILSVAVFVFQLVWAVVYLLTREGKGAHRAVFGRE